MGRTRARDSRRAVVAVASLLIACGSAADADAPTWHRDVAPILGEHCGGCHRPAGAGPFSVGSYEEAAVRAPLIAAALEAGIMPPWSAKQTEQCRPLLAYRHDPRLSETELATVLAWVERGAPEGDPTRPEPIPAPIGAELEDPDAVLTVAEPFPVGGKEDLWVCFTLDPAIEQDMWITGLEVQPDHAEVLHHAIVYADPDAESVGLADASGWYPCYGHSGLTQAWVLGAALPGAAASVLPDGVGMLVTAGSRLVVQVHYHPTGGPTLVDRPGLALRWSEQAPPWFGSIAALGNYAVQHDDGTGLQPGPSDPVEGPSFLIPAGAANHRESMLWEAAPDLPPTRVWSVATHMHQAGRGMRIALERAAGADECLLETPDWDFDWQRHYQFDAPIAEVPQIVAGDRLRMECNYDNTLDNVPLAAALAEAGLDAPMDLLLGETALHEMCAAFVGVAWELP